jgi:MFS family permease
MALAMAALTMFVIAMVASYSGAFAKPSLHHMNVALAGPQQFLDGVRGQDTLAVTEVVDAADARQQVYDRKTDAAFAVGQTGDLKIYVAGGGGRSVANAAETVGRGIAAKAGLTPSVEDVAPTSPADPQGTVEFYAIIFLSIGATLGASAFGWIAGRVRHPWTLTLRTFSLAAYSALLAGAVTVYVDAMLGALTGHTWQIFGVLWLYAMAVGGAVTGVAAAFGTVASVMLTLFLVIVGNAAAAGPVGLPLLSGFYTTFNAIVPQGSGVALLRSVEYFGGNGAVTPIVTLAIWGAGGFVLAVSSVLAPRAWTNYRARHDSDRVRQSGPDRAVLRPRVLSPAD